MDNPPNVSESGSSGPKERAKDPAVAPRGQLESSQPAPSQPILPYASEPFGVYQPLVGWRSQLQHERIATAAASRVRQATREILRTIPVDSPKAPTQPPPRILVDRTGTGFGRALAARAASLNEPDIVELLRKDKDSFFTNLTTQTIEKLKQVKDAATQQTATSGPSKTDGKASQPAADVQALVTEAGTAAVIKYLTDNAPSVAKAMFRPSISGLNRLVSGAKLITEPHPAQTAFLSPIGVLHLFREYFFQIGTFLGPPVGHVWISPGGTVEMVEVNTRRQVVERATELSTETTTKTEFATTDQDELSDAIKSENSNDMKLGASVTASGGIGSVFQASGSASFGLDNSRKQAEEQTHKKMREQSAKLSSEVRQNYKTTFRTVTETTDSASRRYVLQNTTEKLVSYELSRKMRKVAVQVQDLGERLCWQLYVDNPGDPLGTGEFVHSVGAEVDPNLKPPEHQPYPIAQPKSFSAAIPYIQIAGGDNDSDDAYRVDPKNRDIGFFDPDIGDTNKVIFKHTINLPPTPADFVIREVTSLDFHGAQVEVDPVIELDTVNSRFTLWLKYAFWAEKSQIPFDGIVQYDPSPAVKTKIDDSNAKAEVNYNQQAQQAKEKAFYDTLRERLKLAGQVRPRPQGDLREEERNVIYRNIVSTLYGNEKGWTNTDYHVASEMIRYFFDIDSMLYFIAPDWWLPRTQAFIPRRFQVNAPLESSILTDPIFPLSDRALRSGKSASNVLPGRRPHYLISEESAPAPQGASLGWLIQLDGDTNRNAFLNSPWVKAVLPMRPGRERDALVFLQRTEVAGTEGLDEPYPFDANKDPPEYKGLLIKDVLLKVADKIADGYAQENKPVPIDPKMAGSKMALPTETVFARGFDPLQEGVAFGKGPFTVFSEWTEVLPTDQVVATEYVVPANPNSVPASQPQSSDPKSKSS